MGIGKSYNGIGMSRRLIFNAAERFTPSAHELQSCQAAITAKIARSRRDLGIRATRKQNESRQKLASLRRVCLSMVLCTLTPHALLAQYVGRGRVSNRKSESMQIQSASMFFSRSTPSKIETTLQIGEILEKVRANAILYHTHKYKYGYVTKPMRVVK